MKLREIIKDSIYSPTGYIKDINTIDKVEAYIEKNKPVLKEFGFISVVFNYDDKSVIEPYKKMWKSHFRNCWIDTVDVNRGHNFGTADLDNKALINSKLLNHPWLCKSDNDVVFLEEDMLLDEEINEADFYYLNGIGYGGMEKYNFDYDEIIKKDFYPQTWFYFIKKDKVNFINDPIYLEYTWEQVQQIENYNGRVWEYIPGWSCEDLLKGCVNHFGLKSEHLINEKTYMDLISNVKIFNIHDCSHKNIIIRGICHLQYPEQNVLHIENRK